MDKNNQIDMSQSIPFLQVIQIDLQHNELTTIPGCLLELPRLSELNLSHNRLTMIPDMPKWSACLTVLDLSHNQLTSMPINAVAPVIYSLNLSHNNFNKVPLCICSFVTLQSLNLSDNPDILTLPAEMGRLKMLNRLHLNNLKDLTDPPKSLQNDPQDCIRYLNSKLRCAKEFYRMKLMLVGLANRGKTTLVKRLQGKEWGDESTVGVDVSEWRYKPNFGKKPFHFSIWDFAGQQEYYATHQCFLSQHSLYLLLFNLSDGDAGVQELMPWLNNIALRAPHACVIIIGTHLDEVPEEMRGEIDMLLHRVGDLAETYQSKLQIVEVIPVGLKNRIENISILKDAIYNHAANYKTCGGQFIMGKKIPASYHTLDKQLQQVQHEVRQGLREPVMHVSEFNNMVKQMNLADIEDEEELKTAALFLTDVGSLLHYDDRSHNLHELYFVDPRWLCDMMSKVVTVKERNPFVKKGILYSKDIPLLFKDIEFPWKYFEQYLTLLDHFEIALLLDNRRVLIPSMLPEERPKHLSVGGDSNNDVPFPRGEKGELVYSRYILFNGAQTPPGFWDRLLSRIMHSIPQVCFALDKTMPSTTLAEDVGAVEVENDQDVDLGVSLSIDMSTETGHSPPPSSASSFSSPRAQLPPSGPFTDFTHSSSSISNNSCSRGLESSGGQQIDPKMETSFLPPQPEISRPLKEDYNDHLIHAPHLLPDFPGSLPIAMQNTYNVKDIQLDYWRTGLFYSDPEPLMFRIESLAKSLLKHQEKDGVLIVASSNSQGKKIIGKLVDLVLSLIHEWYPGLVEGQHGTVNLEQMVPCFECLKLGRPDPFEFKVVKHCMPEISKNKTTIECGYYGSDSATNHTVSLADIVPDLLLQDIDMLTTNDISYQEDEASLLGKGGFGRVYRGKCRNKSVAIKKYIMQGKDTYTELRSEAQLLQQLHHPCLICLVGVCVHPIMALVLEEAPLKSLDFHIFVMEEPIHRLTIFRIAAEVAAALRFLHSQGVIFRGPKAADVLLWTLDPASLCHCKVTDFGIATHMAPMGVRGLQGSKSFLAPEVLHIGKRRQQSVYDHKADIFSFSMFLHQLITRRHPYEDIPPHRIDVAVEAGERPKLQDVDVASTGYHYLTMLMKKCWEDNPKNRPTTEEIIKTVCLTSVQSLMCVFPVKSRFSLQCAVALTLRQGHLWVCCSGAEGAELNIYNSKNMALVSRNYIKDNQVQCMALCNDHVWVASRAGIQYGVINIFDLTSRKLVHNICMRENFVSCLTATGDQVLIGTLEGYCFSFSNNMASMQDNAKPRYKYVSERAVDGIACTHDFIWVSHTRHISFLNPKDLALEESLSRVQECDAFIGQLSASPEEDIIWSAHLGGVILTAWDAHNRSHSFDIDSNKVLIRISEQTNTHNAIITAMLPVLDTVWLGMATGHILVFHKEELLTWYRPYTEYVRFLSLISGSGPCEMERCMVMSGGKGFVPLVDNMGPDSEKEDESLEKAGTLIMWEAYEARTMRQVKLIEDNAPSYLDNHNSIRMMIHSGDFKDGTFINKAPQSGEETESTYGEIPPYTPDTDAQPDLSSSFSREVDSRVPLGGRKEGGSGELETFIMGGPSPTTLDSLRADHTNSFTLSTSCGSIQKLPVEEELSTGQHLSRRKTLIITPSTPFTHEKEMFEIILPGPESTQVVCVACPRPPQLKVLLSELQVNTSFEGECRLEYERRPGDIVKLSSQKRLEVYLALPTRPKLFVARCK